jgi:hypothetical protein
VRAAFRQAVRARGNHLKGWSIHRLAQLS